MRFRVVFYGCFPVFVMGLNSKAGGFAVGAVLGFCGSLFPFFLLLYTPLFSYTKLKGIFNILRWV
jgi:hypothetical protein